MILEHCHHLRRRRRASLPIPIPKGLHHSAQQHIRVARNELPWEIVLQNHQPQRGSICRPCPRATTCCNPVGLISNPTADPGELVPRNPGLRDGIPSGSNPANKVTRQAVRGRSGRWIVPDTQAACDCLHYLRVVNNGDHPHGVRQTGQRSGSAYQTLGIKWRAAEWACGAARFTASTDFVHLIPLSSFCLSPWRCERDLQARRKNDPAKPEIAARRRQETTLPIKEIAARVPLGTSKRANRKLHDPLRRSPAYDPAPAQLAL
jgi:hypothetical protein